MDDRSGLIAQLRAHARAADESGEFPVANITLLREHGVMGWLVPKRYGGQGETLRTMITFAGRIGGACASTAMIWTMHCQQVDALLRHGSDELRDRLLPRIAAGDLYLASVTTERGKGGHLLSAHDPLVGRGDQLEFSRDAPVVTGGLHADGYLITLRAAEEATASEVSLVYADRSDVTVTPTGGWDAMGMRATESVGLRLDGRVPPANIVGAPGGFAEIALDSFGPLAHLGWSACWLGAAQGAFAEVVSWVRRGRSAGAPDPSSEIVRLRLARIRLDLELVSAYLWRTLDEVEAVRDTGGDIARTAVQIHLNTLKLAASDLTFRAVDEMIALAGLPTGYSNDSPIPLARTFRDLRSAALNYSNDRLWLANGGLIVLDRQVELL